MGNSQRFLMVAMAAAVIGCGPDSGPGLLGSGGTSGGGSGGSGGNASGGSNGNGSGGNIGSGGSNGSGGDNGPMDAAGSGGDTGSGGANGSGGSNGSGGDNGGGTDGGSGGTGGADAGGLDVPMVGSSSGVPRTTIISDLTDDQRPTLCDWWNAKQGGYGQSADCGGQEPEVTDGDQAECVAGLNICGSATVANFEDCANAMGTDLCKFRTDPACATLAACFAP